MTNPDLTDVLDFAHTVNHLPAVLRRLLKGAFANPTDGTPKLLARLEKDADETEIVAFLLADAIDFAIVNAEPLAELFDAWLLARVDAGHPDISEDFAARDARPADTDDTDDDENVDLMIAEANLDAPKGGRS